RRDIGNDATFRLVWVARPESSKGVPPRRSAAMLCGLSLHKRQHFLLHGSLLVRLQHRQERLLRNVYLPHLLHAFLALGLLGPQLALARDVAAVALRRHVLLQRRDALARDDAATDRRLQDHLKEMAVDLLAQLLQKLAAAPLRCRAMHDR